MNAPSIGRMVHYQSLGSADGTFLPEPRAAIVTAVGGDGMVSLAVMNPNGLYFNTAVPFSESPEPGHWSWPPRVG